MKGSAPRQREVVPAMVGVAGHVSHGKSSLIQLMTGCRMNRAWRNPALPAGVVLLVLGLGNWAVSCSRIAEYEPRANTVPSSPRVESLADFSELTPRTNTTLLKRLKRDMADYTVAGAKLDFYRVVQSGGRLLSALGLVLITAALAHSWRKRGRAAR